MKNLFTVDRGEVVQGMGMETISLNEINPTDGINSCDIEKSWSSGRDKIVLDMKHVEWQRPLNESNRAILISSKCFSRLKIDFWNG